ncbi:hypothetical protein BDQ17DRAFT_1421221 [Cyathus striatus]|nr:hypothetical protein BDQ17DRAFT_1421221 [Cyathus striatus]
MSIRRLFKRRLSKSSNKLSFNDTPPATREVPLITRQSSFKNIPTTVCEISQDIVDLIVDAVALNDDENYTSLKVCALVSKCFLGRSRFHLFHTVHLGNDSQRNGDVFAKYTRFAGALGSSPELALYIRKFCLDDHDDNKKIYREPTFPGIIAMLKNITTLYVSFENIRVDNAGQINMHFSWTPVSWKFISNSLREAIIKALHLPSINEVKIRGLFDIPQSFINPFFRVPVLALYYCSISGQNSGDELDQHPSYSSDNLKSLKFCHLLLPYVLDPFLGRLSSSDCRLEELVNINPSKNVDYETVETILAVQSNFLTTLKLTTKHMASLDISDFPCLQNIFIYMSNEGSPSENPLPDPVLQTLSKAQKGNQIQNITCVLGNYGHHIQLDWKGLDLLLSSSLFAELQSVRFVFPYGPHLNLGDIENVQVWMRKLLPAIHQRVALQIETEVNPSSVIWCRGSEVL